MYTFQDRSPMRFRSHWGDADADGCRELGAGLDLGPVTVDQKSELASAIAFGGCSR